MPNQGSKKAMLGDDPCHRIHSECLHACRVALGCLPPVSLANDWSVRRRSHAASARWRALRVAAAPAPPEAPSAAGDRDSRIR